MTNTIHNTLKGTLLGGSSSLASLIIGNCEGTRTPLGGFTDAYYGHTDPGNAKHNLGSFSYQGISAKNPATADVVWQQQIEKLLLPKFVAFWESTKYNHIGLMFAWFNSVDLYTQAPLAVVDKAGLFDRINEAPAQEMSALRAKSFIDERGVLHAAGFNNSYDRLLADQQRRVSIIAKFFAW